jgi:membrane associated rhomboid family serine protease
MTNRSLWLLLLVLTLAVLGLGAGQVYAQRMAPDDTERGPLHLKVVLTEGMENVLWHAMRIARCVYWMMIASHFLFALLVLLDIQKRKQGNLLFVVLTLIGGALAAAVYALFRLGDAKT